VRQPRRQCRSASTSFHALRGEVIGADWQDIRFFPKLGIHSIQIRPESVPRVLYYAAPMEAPGLRRKPPTVAGRCAYVSSQLTISRPTAGNVLGVSETVKTRPVGAQRRSRRRRPSSVIALPRWLGWLGQAVCMQVAFDTRLMGRNKLLPLNEYLRGWSAAACRIRATWEPIDHQRRDRWSLFNHHCTPRCIHTPMPSSP
jgi:hypothetical protein